MKSPLLSVAAIAAALALPVGASAATLQPTQAPNTIVRGIIASVNGTSDLTVYNGEGFTENVELHKGTIIAPTGLQLQPGMHISVLGYQAGTAIDADRITGPVAPETVHGIGSGATRTSLGIEPIPNGTFQTQGPTAAGGG
ncbi:MAG TPA: hypothetical protein VE591_05155 [Candidatus Acidoferrum sp.]|nr:hypothetical protein [Candidatus Acidoferrum sp.]